jgi:glycosyltransferase involved in cell wall biosynthesis
MHIKDYRVRAISLAHNQGHQNALMAGLMYVCNKCDAAISIDADLQDDPEAIVEMVHRFNDGDEIVYGVRRERKTDTWFKRTTAHTFYKFQRKMGVKTIYDHADYRLMSNRALQLLSEYKENNLFLRGIVPTIGLKHSIVEYARAERIAGESKYPLSKMLALSIDGITSFSAKPMRMIFLTGLCMVILDILIALWVLIAYFNNNTISGWASVMLSIWFLGGLILIGLGIVGEYIGKIFVEVKHRPRYAISEVIW